MEILKHEGKPAFVVLPYAEYLAIQERLEDLQASDDIASFRRDMANGKEELVPEDVMERLLNEVPVKVWREYRGLSQKALAKHAALTASMLSQIEKGNKKGSLDTLCRIARVLNVSIDDLT